MGEVCGELALPMPLPVSLAGGSHDASRVPSQLLAALRQPRAPIPLTPSLKARSFMRLLSSLRILEVCVDTACLRACASQPERRRLRGRMLVWLLSRLWA